MMVCISKPDFSNQSGVGLHWASLGFTGLHWASLGFAGPQVGVNLQELTGLTGL
jgi:hypothetical protein